MDGRGGRGQAGVATVARRPESRPTLSVGVARRPRAGPLRPGRSRAGGGRKRAEAHDEDLVATFESLIDPVTRGDPMSPCGGRRNRSAR